jgi:hypothetical protein
MIHHLPPKLDYCGLTIVMSNPSRFDLTSGNLLSANGGSFFCNDCLYSQGFNRYQCDIRTTEALDKPLLKDTYCVLVLGEVAHHKVSGLTTSLGEQRGSPIFRRGLPTIIVSYLPQDALDMKDLEQEFNPLLNGLDEDDNDDGDANEKSRHGKTRRPNWAFWLKKDVEKACTLVKNKGNLPKDYDTTETTYKIFPPEQEVISVLSSTKGQYLYFDIETDSALNITVFSFSFTLGVVYVVPLLRYDYSVAYSGCHFILRALAIAIRDNILVAHNGAGFDFFVLAHKYKIGISRNVYDTMLAQNRIYPEQEKSLGHCISLPWMWEPYHKNEGNFAYRNRDQELQLWQYCGKDVSSLIQLHKAQTLFARSNVGLQSSISDCMSYIRPYLITILQGIRFSSEVRDAIINENDRLMNQYLRFLDILVGDSNLKTIRGSGKSAMPGSSKQCAKYFYGMLNYPVQGRSKKTGEPSLDAKACFKLKLALKVLGINNPVIDIVLAYRAKLKETGSLKFKPWKE